MKIYVITNSEGRCFLSYTLKKAEEIIKIENLGDMPKFDGENNGIKAYVGINQEDSYIQICELKKEIGGMRGE